MNSQDICLECPKCLSSFTEQNPPKDLKNCSHVICLECLKTEILCPIDRKRLDFRRHGPGSFTNNQTIMKEILKEEQQQKHKQIEIQKVKQLVLKEKEFDSCLLHSKPAQLICMSDKQFICANCALFGEHKTHNILPYESLLTSLTQLTEQSYKYYEELRQTQQSINEEAHVELIQQSLKDRRDEIVKKIKSFYQKIHQNVRKCQKQSVSNVDILMKQKKEDLSQCLSIKELTSKTQLYLTQITQLYTTTEQALSKMNIQNAINYIDQTNEKSFIEKNGEYLLLEIKSYDNLIRDKIERQCGEFDILWKSQVENMDHWDFCNWKIEDRQVIEKYRLEEEQKNKNKKKYSYSRKVQIMPQKSQVQNELKKSIAEDDLLLNTETKEKDEQQTISPIQNLPISNFDHSVTSFSRPEQNKENAQIFLKITQMPPISHCSASYSKMNCSTTKNRQRIPNQISNSTRALKMEEFSRNNNELSARNKSSRSINKSINHSNNNTERQILSMLNNEPKKRKKLQLPVKFSKVYEELLKDSKDTIDFGDAQLGDAQILMITQCLPKTVKLKSLKLMNNKISDEIFPILIERCTMCSIISLNLSYNQLSESSLAFLEQQFEGLHKLKNITLSKNKIVLRHVKQRIEGLKRAGINVSV